MAPAAGTDDDDALALTGRVVAGRYLVERYVARGGFGSVYRATHVELSSPVALKVLSAPAQGADDAADVVERFRREARTLAALKHPAIVRVLDVGRLDPTDGNRVWMALEWIDGVTLDEDLRARDGRGRSPREALELLGPAFEAIASAHERGVVHRDLKPANLMVSPGERGGFDVRVLDFGIAKEMLPDETPGSGQTETRSETSMFSLQHAAPEQLGRARTGPWTDVHALGLLLTEVVTGRRAYRGETSFDLYAAVMSPERPTPSASGVAVGPWEPLLRRALSLRASERFSDAGELSAALVASVDDAQAAWERPPPAVATTTSPAGRRVRRRIAGVVIALAGSVLVVAATLQASHRSAVVARAPVVPPAVAASVAASVAAPSVAVVPADVVAIAPAPPEVTPRRSPRRARPSPPAPAIRGGGDPEVMVE